MEVASDASNARRAAVDRKSIERRSRSNRRKSGPKSADVETSRQGGIEGRRRMSDTHRRNSRNKAAVRRRERSELRPPLAGGHPGIGRSSLPARLPPARFSNQTARASGDAVAGDSVAVAEKSDGVEAMQQDEQEEKKPTEEEEEEEARWTPEMVAEAARGILGPDRQLQLRYDDKLTTKKSLKKQSEKIIWVLKWARIVKPSNLSFKVVPQIMHNCSVILCRDRPLVDMIWFGTAANC